MSVSIRGIAGAAFVILVAAASPTGAARSTQADLQELVAELRQEAAGHHQEGLASTGAFANRPPRARNLSMVGFDDLGGGGFNSDVWAQGQHAYVGTWGAFGVACPNDGTKVIDISDPSDPEVVEVLPAPPGTQTNDVKVERVSTPFFTGDLLVVSNEDCDPAGGGRGFEVWDVTDPENPAFLSRFGPEVATDTEPFLKEIGFGVHNTFIFERGNRVFVAAVVDFAEIFQLLFDGVATVGDLRIVEVTDPTNPVQVADWGAIKDLGLDPFATGQGDDSALSFLHDVWEERGIGYLSWWDAGLILVDLTDPESPAFLSRTPYDPAEEGNTHVAVPARGGNLVVTGDEDFTPGPWGFMRVFDARDETAPFQVSTFATDNALNAPPPAGDFTIHNVITRGNIVYASWYSDGIRLIDISQPGAPREVASFVPAAFPDPHGVLPTAPEMWGVYVHRNLVLGSDMNAGLYVLRTKP